MTISPVKRLITALFILSALPLSLMADQQQQYQQSIENLAAEIKQISRNLNANRALLKTEKDKLSFLEQKIIGLDQKLSGVASKIEQQKRKNNELDTQILELEKKQEQDREALIKLFRERYMRGEPNYIKMLLNQENPYAVGRLSNYLDYFTKAQKAKFEDLRQKTQKKLALQTQQKENLKDLEGHYNQQYEQQTALDEAKLARQESVKNLESKVSESSEKLDQLQQDRQRLNSLLEQIAKQAEELRKLEQQRLEALPKPELNPDKPRRAKLRPLVKGGFVKQRGRLQYPVVGNAEYRFGKRIAATGMRAQGTFLATKGSQEVKSIFRGRVLFADYLKGYGLLLIIDHGDEHISLYGHNEVLYKRVGDQVQTSEMVAKTGVSGGLKSHGLYFEIRNTATPVDPAIWCR